MSKTQFLAELSALPPKVQAVFNNKTEVPTYTNLPEGEHVVTLHELKILFSDKNWDGSKKDKVHPFEDKTFQIGYRIVSAEGNGSIIGRHNMQSFVRTGDLTEEQTASGDYHDIDGMACTEKDGKYTRNLSDERQLKNQSLQNSMTYAVGEPEQEFSIALNSALEKKTKFIVKVVSEPVPGTTKKQLVIKSWAPAVAEKVDPDTM